GQVPAEPPTDVASQDNQSPLPESATSAITKPGARKLGQVPAEPRIDSELRSDQSPVAKSASNAITKPGSEKLGLVPAYVKTAGEKAWLKKMSGSVF
ncbi:MAG: hypothetical protein NXI22_22160, partial [bacterium]|nr:hypothetical protein [bacterium]